MASLLIGGIAGPRWGWDWEAVRGAVDANIVIVLDMSRSMLARDVCPTASSVPGRGQRIAHVHEQPAAVIRIGLIAFASGAKHSLPADP